MSRAEAHAFPTAFDDMGDDLPWTHDEPLAPIAPLPASHLNLPPPKAKVFERPCARCGGSGRWGWVSQYGSVCLKCNGSGKQVTKTDPVKLKANREASAARKAARKAEAIEAWKAEHPAAWAWIEVNAPSGGFGSAMRGAILQWGSLTPGQLSAVERCVERHTARTALREEAIATAPSVPEVAAVTQAFARATSNGVSRPTLRLGAYKLKLAPSTGKNPGAIYITRLDDDQYLGKVVGTSLQLLGSQRDSQADVLDTLRDPASAAIAYGHKTGACSVCGRTLTDPVSVDRGIGPICADNYGF